ncbi:MAG: hypothetical protein ACK2U9_12150 [Anaerolineae bacterium]
MKFHPNARVIYARKRQHRLPACHLPGRTGACEADACGADSHGARDRPRRAVLPDDPWREIRLGGMVLMVIALLSALAG